MPAASMLTTVLAGQKSCGRQRSWVSVTQNRPAPGARRDVDRVLGPAGGWRSDGEVDVDGLGNPTIDPFVGLKVGGRNGAVPDERQSRVLARRVPSGIAVTGCGCSHGMTGPAGISIGLVAGRRAERVVVQGTGGATGGARGRGTGRRHGDGSASAGALSAPRPPRDNRSQGPHGQRSRPRPRITNLHRSELQPVLHSHRWPWPSAAADQHSSRQQAADLRVDRIGRRFRYPSRADQPRDGRRRLGELMVRLRRPGPPHG